jgi:hypothetical protein
MAVSQPEAGKKYFTVDEANRMLPLVRAIVRDIGELYRGLSERAEALQELDQEHLSLDRRDELERQRAGFEEDEDRLRELLKELHDLGVDFKGFDLGLVDFPCWQDGREVSLCWKYGEPAVEHWHEVWAGFAGRKPIR